MTWPCLFRASLGVLTPAPPLLPQAPGCACPKCGPVSLQLHSRVSALQAQDHRERQFCRESSTGAGLCRATSPHLLGVISMKSSLPLNLLHVGLSQRGGQGGLVPASHPEPLLPSCDSSPQGQGAISLQSLQVRSRWRRKVAAQPPQFSPAGALSTAHLTPPPPCRPPPQGNRRVMLMAAQQAVPQAASGSLHAWTPKNI